MYCFNTYPHLPAAILVPLNIFYFCAEYRCYFDRHCAFGTFYFARILKTAPRQKKPARQLEKKNRTGYDF